MHTEIVNDNGLVITKNRKRNRKTKVRNLVSFDKGNIRMFLRFVTPFNRDKGCYEEPFIRLVTLVDGRYVRVPPDPELLKDLGLFLTTLGETMESIGIREEPPTGALIRDRMDRCVSESKPLAGVMP